MTDEQTPNEFTMTSDSAWVTAYPFSVCIRKTDDGLSVDLYPYENESAGDAVASCWAMDSDLDLPEPDDGP